MDFLNKRFCVSCLDEKKFELQRQKVWKVH